MLVLKLCQQNCADKIPFNIEKKLGDGADGEVFEIKESDRVIKFSVIYEWDTEQLPSPICFPADINLRYNEISKILDYLIDNPIPAYVRVYARRYLGEYSRPIVWGEEIREQKLILHYYIMEKLNKLTEDEMKVFHTILFLEDRRINKILTIKKIREMLIGMSRGLDFDLDKVIFFVENFRNAPVIYNDLHPRNVGKNAAGNFFLIDLDRSKLNIGE